MILFSTLLKLAQERKAKKSGIVYNHDWTDQFKVITHTNNELDHYAKMGETRQKIQEKEKDEGGWSVREDNTKD